MEEGGGTRKDGGTCRNKEEQGGTRGNKEYLHIIS